MPNMVTIDAQDLHYTPLNRRIREAVARGADEIVLEHVLGQRFIADGLRGPVTIHIHGIPGGDLGMYMRGPHCIVHGNADHAPGNTMDDGCIAIHGSAGDAVAHSMRGGMVLVRDDIGYRGAIHMKAYRDHRPVLVVGGTTRAFLGEYMAGGVVIVLGLESEHPLTGAHLGTGMHGGAIYVRGEVEDRLLGVGTTKHPLSPDGRAVIAPCIRRFASAFGMDPDPLCAGEYTVVTPASSRPFAGKYTWEI